MSRLLQLSEAVSLALHGAVLIASRPGELFSVRRIAEDAGASGHHLAKVLQRLVKAGILTSVRGPRGGFALAVPARDLTLLDIYEAMEGRSPLALCPSRRPSCPFRDCIFGGLLQKLDRDAVAYLAAKKLSEFAPGSAEETA